MRCDRDKQGRFFYFEYSCFLWRFDAGGDRVLQLCIALMFLADGAVLQIRRLIKLHTFHPMQHLRTLIIILYTNALHRHLSLTTVQLQPSQTSHRLSQLQRLQTITQDPTREDNRRSRVSVTTMPHLTTHHPSAVIHRIT